MKKILILLLACVIILVLLTQRDDELSPEAIALISRIDDSAQSESYIYLLGMEAHEDEDPADAGALIFEELRRGEANENYEIVEYPEPKRIAVPTGELFCSTREDGCISNLLTTREDIDQLAREHATLVERSSRFLSFSEYTTLTKPTVSERLPPYQYIAAAERIKLLKAISQYRDGDRDQAVASLLDQFDDLRRGLALQDQLIGKLVLLIRLSDILDVLSVILSETGETIGRMQELTVDERDFGEVASREFALTYYSLKELNRHPKFFDSNIEVPGWVVRVLFKPNMTINAIAPTYTRLHRLSRMSPEELAAYIEGEPLPPPSTSILRNPAGSALAQVSTGMDEYASQFADFQTKVALFNHLHHLKKDVATASNPYYPGEEPEVIGDKACFRGPLRDFRSMRCLRIR